MKPTICLISGKTFDFTNPRPLTMYEVAYALSNLCRFNGHCRGFYSVAQHSVMVSELVHPEFALQGLLHDAVEAVVGDMTSPLKRLIPGYREIENLCAKVILEGFGVPAVLDPSVCYADLVALATEKRDLMPHCDPEMDWSILDGIEPLSESIRWKWIPDEAFSLFSRHAYDLGLSW